MKAIVSTENLASHFVLSFWTPVFVGIFLAIVRLRAAPSQQDAVRCAANMPLRED